MARSRSKSDAALIAAAEKQAAEDAAAFEAFKQREATAPPQPRLSLRENFEDVVGMIAESRRKSRLTETSLVRIWELTLMWALNNRNQTPSFPTQEIEGNGSEATEEQSLPVPNEIIGAVEETTLVEE